MITAGLDIGSRTVALAVVDEGAVTLTAVEDATHEPLEQCRRLLKGRTYDRLVATGYGRHLARDHVADTVVTEILAFSVGARRLFPGARTILDVGGQDTKAIALAPSGRILDFHMNDRCAAGTGKFLEFMAQVLGLSLDDFCSAAQGARDAAEISSFCTVFAESEVTGLIAKNIPRGAIARGLHKAMGERAISLLKRVPIERDVVFCGGGARNQCLREILEEGLDLPLLVPEDPQTVGAIGAALCADDRGAF